MSLLQAMVELVPFDPNVADISLLDAAAEPSETRGSGSTAIEWSQCLLRTLLALTKQDRECSIGVIESRVRTDARCMDVAWGADWLGTSRTECQSRPNKLRCTNSRP